MVVETELDEVWSTLQKEHGIHSGYYPGMNLEDLPRGPLTEVGNVCSQLAKQGLQCTASNVYQVFQVRRELVQRLAENTKLTSRIPDAIRGKTGFTGYPLFDLVIYLTPLLLFGKGFFTRLGQNFADYVFKHLTSEHSVPEKEAREISEIMTDFEYDERKHLLKFRLKAKWE